MRVKAHTSLWPQAELVVDGSLLVGTTQYALGCYERWLAGDGDEWLDATRAASEHLLAIQQPDGRWLQTLPMRHTFDTGAPWASGITQGQGASLFVRMHEQTGEERFADAAKRALASLWKPQPAGGLGGELGGLPWPEEYPTAPQSHVLNGAMFALWGMRDVAVGLGDAEAAARFEAGVDSVAANLHRYDTGSWSLYSLYPHPVRNRASSFYHSLHIYQLTAMGILAPRPEFEQARIRWQGYADSASSRARAFAWKAAFRTLVPRNQLMAHRLPWTPSGRP
jgi:hypothetical protein